MDPKIINGAKILVFNCACLKKGEKVLILSEKSTYRIGRLVEEISTDIAAEVTHKVLSPQRNHGEEPKKEVASLMKDADVIFCLTLHSLAHTIARKQASENGARFLSLPDYSEKVLSSDALRADFKAQEDLCNRISEILSNAKQAEVRSALGTELFLNISGRIANPAPGICDYRGCLASPPDIEVNIAPQEFETEGVIVIDGSIPITEIGVLKSTLTLSIEQGRIKDIKGQSGVRILRRVFERNKDDKVYVLGELGIGLNPLARFCGRMLEDEGVMGAIHFGFGSNSTIGGKNKASFHTDMVMKNGTLLVDSRKILRKGKLCI